MLDVNRNKQVPELTGSGINRFRNKQVREFCLGLFLGGRQPKFYPFKALGYIYIPEVQLLKYSAFCLNRVYLGVPHYS
jgi:hypothetical protein